MGIHDEVSCLYVYVSNLYLCLYFPKRQMRDKTSSKMFWDILAAILRVGTSKEGHLSDVLNAHPILDKLTVCDCDIVTESGPSESFI